MSVTFFVKLSSFSKLIHAKTTLNIAITVKGLVKQKISYYFYLSERESMCEDHFNSKNRVIAMKNSNANCTWTVAEPEYNRVWMRVSVLQTKKDNSTVCQNSLMVYLWIQLYFHWFLFYVHIYN